MSLADYKKDFIDLMLECEVLTFGDFTTKSGRQTPFFINSGNFNNGKALLELGRFYAKRLSEELGDDYDSLYGPAYKGIPLAAIAASAIYKECGKTVNYTFNRKEIKDHGEGGVFVGYKYKGGEKVVIVEDVITAGTSVRESIPLIKSFADVRLEALIVSVDRQERGKSEKSALEDVSEEFGIKAFAIVTLSEIISYLKDKSYLDGQTPFKATLELASRNAGPPSPHIRKRAMSSDYPIILACSQMFAEFLESLTKGWQRWIRR